MWYYDVHLVKVNGNSFLRKMSVKEEEMKQTINNSIQIIIPCLLQIIVFLYGIESVTLTYNR